MSRTTVLLSVFALSLGAGTSGASAQVPVSNRVAKLMAQQKGVLPPFCKSALTGSGKINDLITDFKAAVSQPDEAKRTAGIEKAKDGFAHAIQKQDQEVGS